MKLMTNYEEIFMNNREEIINFLISDIIKKMLVYKIIIDI